MLEPTIAKSAASYQHHFLQQYDKYVLFLNELLVAHAVLHHLPLPQLTYFSKTISKIGIDSYEI